MFVRILEYDDFFYENLNKKKLFCLPRCFGPRHCSGEQGVIRGLTPRASSHICILSRVASLKPLNNGQIWEAVLDCTHPCPFYLWLSHTVLRVQLWHVSFTRSNNSLGLFTVRLRSNGSRVLTCSRRRKDRVWKGTAVGTVSSMQIIVGEVVDRRKH